jgi:Ras-related GTP-binding protein C/D
MSDTLKTAGEPSKPRSPNPSNDSSRQRILVLGWRKYVSFKSAEIRAGKSACVKTVFQGVPVKDVPYFGATQKVEKVNIDSIIPLQIWDTPSNFDIESLDVPLGSFSTIIYVMDMQVKQRYESEK